MNKIDKKDISIIVQGPIGKDITEKCLRNIRKYFSGSKIILSTWNGANTKGLDYDKLVLSQEPIKTSFNDENKKELNHTNYQLVSIKNALTEVNTKYCLKIRTDADVKSSRLLNYFNKYLLRNDDYKIFKHRVIVPAVYSRESFDLTNIPMPFHPSDIFMFGLTEDIIDYFKETELLTKKELGEWTCKDSLKKPYKSLTYRYCAEQYFCFSWVKRHFSDIEFYDWSDWNNKNIEYSKKILANNFIFLDFNQHKISSYIKRHDRINKKQHKMKGLITNKVFNKNYKLCSDIQTDVSVVVQGNVSTDTYKTLKSIRKYLPYAEIILSTWGNTDLSGLEGLYDISVFNKDPNAVIFDYSENKANNLNRILVSSFNGIKAANRKYILRLRSDLILKNDNLLKLTDTLKKRDSDWTLFKQKIFVYDMFSIKYNTRKNVKQRMLFHVSDWCYLGLKEDLEELFNISLVNEPEFSRYFETHKKIGVDIHTARLWKMSPEQYIVSQNAKKVFSELNFNHYLDVNEDNIEVSEKFIISNFRVFSQKQWGIFPQKEIYKDRKMFYFTDYEYYSEFEQLRDYNKYCKSNIHVDKIKFLENLYKIKYYTSLRKHFLQLIFSKSSKKIPELISTIAYLIRFLFSLIKLINIQNRIR